MSQEQGYFIRPSMAIDRDFGIHRNAWVRDKRIIGNALCVYLFLLSHDQSFRITLESARKALGLGRDAFITARRTLESAGYLRTVKVTHPPGAVDANGKSIGGRVLRYDIEVLDPDVPSPSAGRFAAVADAADAVDNSAGPEAPEGGLGADITKNPWSDPLTGFPLTDEPLTDEPLTENPTLKEDQEDQENQSSSSAEVTTEAPASDSVAAALPPDDDEGNLGQGEDRPPGDADDGRGLRQPPRGVAAFAREDAPAALPRGRSKRGDRAGARTHDADEPVDVEQLFRAGVEVSLRELDSRLDLSQILRRLEHAGVDGSRVDVPTAASFVLGAAARPVGDPSAYVAAAIIREPARWPRVPMTAANGVLAPRQSMCELEGHCYVDEFRMQCVRCGEEREGWRDERYAAEQAQAARDEAVPRRAVAS